MELDFQSRDLSLGLRVLTSGKSTMRMKKWALGKKHLWRKSWVATYFYVGRGGLHVGGK